jgi:hypothetical protein
MRREHFDLDVTDIDWVDADGDPRQPLVCIDFRGPESLLLDRLTGSEEDPLPAEETDVAFRLQGDPDEGEGDARGVVGVTNRVTGEFILELNEAASDVLTFIRAAREYGRRADDGDGSYRVELRIDGEPLTAYEKNTFLVYDAEGSLLRGESLIPSGVEL